MTNQQAIRVVQEIVRENHENGELEGMLNRYRVAALNRLIRTTMPGTPVADNPTRASSILNSTSHEFPSAEKL